MRAENDELDLQIEKLNAATDRKADEIAAYADLIEATRLKLAADGELNASDQDQLATMADTLAAMELERQGLEQTAQSARDLAEAKREQAKAKAEAKEAAERAAAAAKEHAEQLKAMGEITGGILTGWAKRLEALSPAARAAFDGFRDGADLANASLANLAEASRQTGDLLSQAVRVGGSGFVRWANDVAASALSIEQAFFDQKIAVQQAIDALDA